MIDTFGPSVVKGVMRRAIADCSKVISESVSYASPMAAGASASM